MKGYSYSREDFLDLLCKKYTMEEEVLGCLGDGAENTDYVLCAGDSDLLPPLVKKDEIRFTYNQYKNSWSYVSCTIFAAMGMLSDLINYPFTEDQMKEVDNLSYENPDYVPMRKKGEGWYVKLAVDLVCDRYNSSELAKKYGKVAYYRISKYDNELIENVIGKLYTIDGNMCPTKEWSEDRKDGMIDGTDFGKTTNGHSLDIVCKEGQRTVKDSGSIPYYGLKNKLSAVTNFGANFYVYVPVGDNLEEVKRLNEFKTNLINAIELNSAMWHQTNDKNYQSILHYTNEKHRAKLKDIETELKKYV